MGTTSDIAGVGLTRSGTVQRCSDVTAVRLEVDDDRFVAICGCQWRTPGADHVRDAVNAWLDHRDEADAGH